ncbi:uncharacterized protein LOC115358177 [Myripristis murdjan]|uniref:uncharacterized protein LOC115358177 n=1 Tax=Myripristis murdjan TaxID=586833 RepID=UPI0011763B6F|nr:uncharacterized protein LOC115358177 [Myripristis murdjan]
METWVKLSTVVLLAVTMATVAKSAPQVILDEPEERKDVPLGSSLTLSCSFKPYKRVRLMWCFNRTRTITQCSQNRPLYTELYNKSEKQNSKDKVPDLEKIWFNYTLSNVTFNDSGWYFCCFSVEIPTLQQGCSNGTQVNIIPTLPTDQTSLDWWLWVVVGASSLLLVILIVSVCFSLRRRRRCRNRGIECPIYANTRPVLSKQPSPRPGMQLDSLKTVPPPKTLRTPSPARKYEGRRSPKT